MFKTLVICPVNLCFEFLNVSCFALTKSFLRKAVANGVRESLITVHGDLGVPDISDVPDVPDVSVAATAFHIVRERSFRRHGKVKLGRRVDSRALFFPGTYLTKGSI